MSIRATEHFVVITSSMMGREEEGDISEFPGWEAL